ncbi:MAG: flagellar basal body rod protein FlgB [Candidatus Xenobia bacterium]
MQAGSPFDPFEFSTPLQKALDAATMRQKVIANNIANVNTPGYRAQAVAFEDQMKEALDKWHHGDDADEKNEGESEVCSLEPRIESSKTGKVDINQEMANMAKNQILYAALTQKISGYFGSLKYVIDNSGH